MLWGDEEDDGHTLAAAVPPPTAHSQANTDTSQQGRAAPLTKKLLRVWQKKLRLNQAQASSPSWLVVEDDGSLGCVCCRAAGLDGNFADFKVASPTVRLQWSHLERHQNTRGHQAAAMAYQAGDAVALSSLGAPAAQAWEKVWSELSKGVALQQEWAAWAAGIKYAKWSGV